ncbi:hypothetical protein UlMin_034984 [Ulmus minor]
MDSKKPNKIREIVRLQQILKKWRKLANSSKSSNSSSKTKSIQFLKRTLSLSDKTMSFDNGSVPKGYLAICVGEELKRFVIPTEYLGHQAFHVLLREAEEEFGFHQTGVLRIPCEVSLFESVLKMVENKRESFFFNEFEFNRDDASGCCSSESPLNFSHQSETPMCR